MSNGDDDDIIIIRSANSNPGAQPPYTVGGAKEQEANLETAKTKVNQIMALTSDSQILTLCDEIKDLGHLVDDWIKGVRTYTG